MYRISQELRYSQNFIRSNKLVERLVKQSHISDFENVIDIGAGRGVITKELAKVCKKVIAIELDPNLHRQLKAELNEYRNIQLLNMDFKDFRLPREDYAVFSNIPYNNTSSILKKLFFSPNPPKYACIVMQQEAFERYAGAPKETQLSLLLKPVFDMKRVYKFSKHDFSPRPRVTSVLVEVTNKPCQFDLRDYRAFVLYGTTRWKPTLKKAFKKVFTHEQFKRLAHDHNFCINAKPLDLNYNQWLALYEYYATHRM